MQRWGSTPNNSVARDRQARLFTSRAVVTVAAALLAVLLPSLSSPGANVVRPPTASAAVRTIAFSGETWWVKNSAGLVGPGPNYFSDSARNVTVDKAGRLHLRLTRTGTRWYAAEVVLTRSLGYGTYRFDLATPIDRLDPNVVLGLFTWDDDPSDALRSHREIDFEATRWANPADPNNGQFTVQPWDAAPAPRYKRFAIPPGLASSSVEFTWLPGQVVFVTRDSAGRPYQSWAFQDPSVPTPGKETARMNLWLINGRPPTNGREVEIVVSAFSFTPNPPTSFTSLKDRPPRP